MNNQTDFEKTMELLSPLIVHINGFDYHGLSNILDKNQNGPPLGAADGSFTTEAWTALRDLLRNVSSIESQLGILIKLRDMQNRST